MKIAYFTDTFLPQVNGVATALANQATQLGAEGHDVLIFTPKLDDIPRQKFKAKNVTVMHLPTVPALLYPEFKLGVFGLPRVIQALRKFNPDIIHLHTPLTVGMDAIMAAKLLKKPLIGTVHVYFTEPSYLSWLKYKLAVKLVNRVVERYLNFMFSQCDLILVPSKMLLRQLHKKGTTKPVAFLPNGVTLKAPKLLSEKAKSILKKKYGLEEKVVLHFGRISYEKNVDTLIHSFYHLTKSNSNISLLIIGDGPAKKKLVKLTKKLKIEQKVVFTGFIEHQKLISSGLLSLGDVFATASTMENNPMVVLEAMSFGLPIVGVKQAGLIELLSSNGILVESGKPKILAEQIKKVLFDESLAAELKRRSGKFITKYSIETVVKQLLNHYHNVCSQKKH